MPDKIQVLYDAVSSEYDLGSFNEFKSKMADPGKRKALYDAIGKDYDLGTFDDFNRKIAPSGPVPAVGPTMPSTLPTFQEQMPMMQTNRFTEAVKQDKKKSGSYIGAIHDSFVSAIDPIMYAGDELFIDSYEFLSGKKLDAATKKGIRTTAETIRQVAPFAGPKKTQDKEYVQEVQGGWDMRDGFGVKDMKALGLMGSRVAGDLAIAAAAQSVGVPMGSTYFIQGAGSGYQEYNEMVDKGIVLEDKTAKNAYALTTGVINGLLEKFAFDKIFGSGPAFNAVKKKVTAEVLKQVSKATTKVTVDTIEKTGAQLLKKELSGLGRKAQRAGFAAGVEAITEGSQTALEEGAKILTNAIQGGQIFDEEDIKKNIGWNVFNAAIAGGLMGGPMGIANTMMTNVDNTLVKEIANAKNETELNKIIQELEQSMKDSNASEEEIDAMRQSAVKYNDISKTIPQSATPEARANIIGLIDRRNGIDEKMTNWQAELEQIDESMRPDVEAEMNTLVDAKDMINDEIRENAAGGKFKYFEDKGKFFKQFENTDPVEISKSRFELQNVKDNATPKSQEQVQESGPSSDISQREGAQERVTQKAPIETNLGDSNLDGEEISVKSLIGRRVTYQGVTGTLFQEGQTLSIETPTQIREVGNIDEMSKVTPESMGIETDESIVEPTETGFMVGQDELFNANENPQAAISRDQNGKVMNVVLTTKGGKRRKFRGAVAEDLAYQITLKQISNEPEFTTFLEQNADTINAGQVQEPAQEATARVDEQVPAEQAAQPTVEPAAPSTTVPTYGRITVDRDDSRPVKGKLAKKLVADAKRVLNSIKNFGDFSVNIHDQNSFEQAILEATGSTEFAASRGFYITSNGEIHVNIDNAAPDTVLHEGFHPILDFMAKSNPQVVNDLFNELSTIPEAAGIIEMVNEQYDGEMTQKKEAITNFVAGVANGDIIVNPSNFAKIRRFIANLLKKLGLPIEPKVLLDVNNPTKLVELSKFISEVFETGTEIYQSDITRAAVAKDLRFEGGDLVTKGEYLDYQGNPIPPEKMQFSLGNDYSDTKTKTTFTYLKNRQEFEKLKQDGFITENMVLDDFVGSKFVLHAPDNAFTGTISKNGEVIIEGKGGVFYPIRFHKDGYFWASTSTAAKSMASMLNEMIEDNGGKIYMALVSSPSGKLFSSTTAANGVMEFFASSAMDRAIGLNQSTVIEAITAAAASSSKKKVKKKEKDGTETEKTVEFGLRVDVPKTKVVDGKRKPMTIADVKSFIAKKLNPETSTFDDRKLFSTELIREISDRIKGTRTEQILGRFFDTGILNKSYKQQGNIQKGYKLSPTNISQSLSEMLSEPMLKGSRTQDVYAVLEIEGEVEAVKSDKHESYPMAIRSKSGSRTKVHILQEREQWSDRFADPETGNKVEKDRRFNIFPTSGVSVQPLTLLPKSEIAFQRMAPNGKPSNLTAKQYEQVRTPAFKKWFGDWENDPANASKVVDENGEPLVVYHGTSKDKDFNKFNVPDRGAWFTSSSKEASQYAVENDSMKSSYDFFTKVRTDINASPRVVPVFLNIKKLYDFNTFFSDDEKRKLFYAKSYRSVQKELFRKALVDAYQSSQVNVSGIDMGKGVYVVLGESSQIKSATANVGTFSTEDARIQMQKATPTKETRKGVTVKGKEIVSPRAKARAQDLFTSSGVLGQAIRTFKEQMGGELTAEMKIAERSTNEVLKLMEKYKGVISTQDIDNYLTGNATTKQFPLDLATKLTEMRVHIDGLTGRLIDLGVITAEESKALYENNKGRYMLRSYELFNRKDKGVVTIDNVTKRLKNVDQAKVDAALRFLEAEIAADGKPRTPQELKDEAISRANEYLADNDMSFGGRGVDGSVNTTSLSKRSEYLDKSPEIRALMGEYTDPVYRYYSSIFKLAGLTSHRAYLNNLKAEGMGKFLFDKATGEATTPIAAEGSKSLAPLNGLYTFPEIKEALQQADRENKLLVEYVAGHIRMMKTVYNPATHVKNVLGSLAFSISNGHWLYAGKAFSYIKKANRAKLIELIDILNREGVLNNNIGAGEINQYFDKFADVNTVLQNINNNANKSALAAAGGKAKANLAKIPNALKKAYAIEDDIFKVLGFVNEANMYAKAEYGVEYDALNDTQRAAINKIATEHVKSFYPTFSRVPKFVKTFSKGLLLGNFLSFPVESVRVSYNTISQGVKEARSKNPKIKAIGINRLVGSLLYNGMISALPIFAAMASGDDDDKEKSENQGYGGLLGYLNDTEEQKQNRRNSRLYRAPWNKDSQVITTKFSGGKLVYVDIGSIDSYGYQREVWSAFWDNLSDKNGFNKAMAATLGRIVSPFVDIDMTVAMFKNLLDNKDESGNLIANPELPFEKRLPDYGKFVIRKVAPGVVNSAVKGINYYQAGEIDKVSAEAISQLVRTYNVDVKKAFQNYIYASPYEENTGRTGFKKRLDNAEMIYTKVKNSSYISQEEKEEYYKMAVEAYKKVLMDTNKYYVAAVAAGVDATELTLMLQRAKIGSERGLSPEVLSVIQGRSDLPDEVYIRR